MILNFKTSFGPIKLVQVVTPVEPLIQKVVHRIYCPVYLSLYASIVLFMEAAMVSLALTSTVLKFSQINTKLSIYCNYSLREM